jgi:hypothetical protein
MKLALILLLLLILLPVTVTAELLDPISKPVSHCLQVSNLGDFPDYYIIVYFGMDRGGYKILEQGECLEIPEMGNPKLFAVKKMNFKEEDVGTGYYDEEKYFTTNQGLMHSGLDINRVRGVSLFDAREGIADILDVVSITNVLEIKKSHVVYTYIDGSEEKMAYTSGYMPEPSKNIFHFYWYYILAAVLVAAIVLLKIR